MDLQKQSPPPDEAPPRPTTRWVFPLLLFILTLLTTLWAGGTQWSSASLAGVESPSILQVLVAGIPYAFPLLGILLFHEMGHFIAGRSHKLLVSLPYFIPVPPLPGALGTMGAIIVYKGRISNVKKLIDIAVAGPLAGVVASTVLMVIGLNLSTVQKVEAGIGYVIQEGQSLYYMFLKWVVLGRLPEGYDVFLHPIAWSAWVGLFVTMINLLPVGQLDGGHVAYALLGRRQNLVSSYLHWAMLILAAAIALHNASRAYLRGLDGLAIFAEALNGGAFWLAWAGILLVLKWIGRGYHPPVTDPEKLGRGRLILGIAVLVLFVLLFMPVPIRIVFL